MLDSLFTDLGNMYKTRKTVSEVDESTIILKAFNRSFRDKTNLYIGNFAGTFRIGFFLQDIFCGKDEFAVFFISSDDTNVKCLI